MKITRQAQEEVVIEYTEAEHQAVLDWKEENNVWGRIIYSGPIIKNNKSTGKFKQVVCVDISGPVKVPV